jgi:hypothetical protein
MRRRDFLTAAAFGTALTLLPPSLRRTLAFAGADCTEDEARIVVRGLARAREDGKPLVVFVVPTSDSAVSDRGSTLGMLIDLGSNRELAVLALAHVACASLAAVHCVVPAVPSESDGEPPWMLVIDADGGAPKAIRVEAPEPIWQTCMREATGREGERACFERETRRHCALVVAPLRRALVGTGFGRRARLNEIALGPELAARVRAGAADGGTALPLGLVDRGAPLLLASALSDGGADQRHRTIARLAAAARLRLQAAPPPGARWLRLGDCATYAYNGLDDIVASIGCGMGNVGFRAARILHFLATH